MPKTVDKSLTFPLAGVSRRGPYRQQTRPFSAPWAWNVRTLGPSESRRRGGSRPGLAKFCDTDLGTTISVLVPVRYVDLDGNHQVDLVYVVDGTLGYIRAGVATAQTAALLTEDGDTVITEDGDTIVFDTDITAGSKATVRGGKVFFADSGLRFFDPATGVVETVVASAGTVPSSETLICLYRDRIFLSGSSNVWYCSRQGDHEDWAYGDAIEDPGRAVAGQLEDAAVIGDVVTAMIPWHDQVLVLATENTLWALRGDPATGQLSAVSDEVGVIDTDGWALSPDGLLVFLSSDGIYTWEVGSRAAPQRFSAERIPEELREVDTSAVTVSMAYDVEERGFHLFLTPSTGDGTHWFVDVEHRAFWPQRFPAAQQPLCAALMVDGGLGDVVLGSKDGYVRYFLNTATDDDGTTLESHILIGPVRIAPNDVRDALLAEVHGVVEDLTNSGTVTWRVVMGQTAAEAAEAAVADLDTYLDGGTLVNVKASGSWVEGRNRVERPRTRGPWTVLWLSSTEAWSYEVVAIVARQLGRARG